MWASIPRAPKETLQESSLDETQVHRASPLGDRLCIVGACCGARGPEFQAGKNWKAGDHARGRQYHEGGKPDQEDAQRVRSPAKREEKAIVGETCGVFPPSCWQGNYVANLVRWWETVCDEIFSRQVHADKAYSESIYQRPRHDQWRLHANVKVQREDEEVR